MYILIMVVRIAAVVVFLLPRFGVNFGAGILGLGVLGLVLFFVLSFKDPGYELETMKLADIYAAIKADFICPYCLCKKPHTTVHCHHCRRCVKVTNI